MSWEERFPTTPTRICCEIRKKTFQYDTARNTTVSFTSETSDSVVYFSMKWKNRLYLVSYFRIYLFHFVSLTSANVHSEIGGPLRVGVMRKKRSWRQLVHSKRTATLTPMEQFTRQSSNIRQTTKDRGWRYHRRASQSTIVLPLTKRWAVGQTFSIRSKDWLPLTKNWVSVQWYSWVDQYWTSSITTFLINGIVTDLFP